MAFCSFSKDCDNNSYVTVENKFITKYMPVADGFAVKVYLYGLYLCKNGDFDFSLLDFHAEDAATIPLREKEKRWCFKQYRFASEGTRRPFGLYALAYSYRPSGTLKE